MFWLTINFYSKNLNGRNCAINLLKIDMNIALTDLDYDTAQSISRRFKYNSAQLSLSQFRT